MGLTLFRDPRALLAPWTNQEGLRPRTRFIYCIHFSHSAIPFHSTREAVLPPYSAQRNKSWKCCSWRLQNLDGVSAYMLRQTALSIAPCLTKLFSLSVSTGSFPSEWKCARITPIFKSSDSSLPQNYHPISILPIVSKLAPPPLGSWLPPLETNHSTITFDIVR